MSQSSIHPKPTIKTVYDSDDEEDDMNDIINETLANPPIIIHKDDGMDGRDENAEQIESEPKENILHMYESTRNDLAFAKERIQRLEEQVRHQKQITMELKEGREKVQKEIQYAQQLAQQMQQTRNGFYSASVVTSIDPADSFTRFDRFSVLQFTCPIWQSINIVPFLDSNDDNPHVWYKPKNCAWESSLFVQLKTKRVKFSPTNVRYAFVHPDYKVKTSDVKESSVTLSIVDGRVGGRGETYSQTFYSTDDKYCYIVI